MRIALVTGGAGGLGLATAKQFARDGLKVVIADLDGAAAKAAAATLEGSGHSGIAIDVAREDSVIAAFEEVEKNVGPISVLMHFAGMLGEGGVAKGIYLPDASLADWEKVMRVNATGSFLCVREMARRRKAKPVEHGRIITVSSVAGETGGLQSGTAYSTSKAAVLGLTKTAARDLAGAGITVNCISPGPIDTPMLAASTPATAPGVKYSKLDALPLGRVGKPEEIAAAASFLASVGAGYVTGQVLSVNGGLFIG